MIPRAILLKSVTLNIGSGKCCLQLESINVTELFQNLLQRICLDQKVTKEKIVLEPVQHSTETEKSQLRMPFCARIDLTVIYSNVNHEEPLKSVGTTAV